MATMEAFMGTDYSRKRSTGIRGSFLGAGEPYTGKDFVFDAAQGNADPHVREYLSLIASGNAEAVTAKLKSFLVATRDALKSRLSSNMTDEQTQEVVDIIGRLNLITQVGVPTTETNTVSDYKGEINDLVSQLMERRKQQYASHVDAMNYYASRRGEQQQEVQMTEIALAQGVPGGGAASIPAQEKSALQKYGPVAALAAGGIAAYFALR